jgi:hypothetical protein
MITKMETDDGGGAPTEIKLQTKNHAILSDARSVMKKALHAAQDKIYFVTNQPVSYPRRDLVRWNAGGYCGGGDVLTRRIFLGSRFPFGSPYGTFSLSSWCARPCASGREHGQPGAIQNW